MRPVHLLDDIVVKALNNGDSGIIKALLQHSLGKISLKSSEDIAGTKVNPLGSFYGFLYHFLPVKGGNEISLFLPGTVFYTCCIKFHMITPLVYEICRWLPRGR